MAHKDHPNRNPLNTGTRRITLVGIAGPDESEGIARTTNGGLDVNIQDQFTDVVIAHFTQTIAQTTMSAVGAIDDLTIEVADATGIVTGHHITIFNATEARFYFGHILNVAGTTLTLDTPLDFAFPSGSFVDTGIDDMAVNGAVTTQVFGLRGGGTPSGVDLDFDCTRVVFQCLVDSAANLALFGNIAALANGLVLRKRDGEYHNIFNVKTNNNIAGIAFDFDIIAALNPVQGQDGFKARLTFGGQSKIGVTIRLGVGEDLEFLVQDNLTGITSLIVTAEGHIVE